MRLAGPPLPPLIGRRGPKPRGCARSVSVSMEGAVSDVGICNLAYAGRLEELRAQLLHDRALATKADQVSRLRPSLRGGAGAGGLWGRSPPGGSCQPLPAPRSPPLPPSGQPHRAALGLLGGAHGRRRPPAGARRACGRQG